MNTYKDKYKQDLLDRVMQGRKKISYTALKKLEKDKIIEDYDVIRIDSKHFKDMYMFYLDNNYYLVNREKKNFRKLDETMLEDRQFYLSRCITNGVQDFMQKKGLKAFNELSTKQFIEVLLNQSKSLLNDCER